jgi:hypothetical protein
MNKLKVYYTGYHLIIEEIPSIDSGIPFIENCKYGSGNKEIINVNKNFNINGIGLKIFYNKIC